VTPILPALFPLTGGSEPAATPAAGSSASKRWIDVVDGPHEVV
jgi:hypothetical protein